MNSIFNQHHIFEIDGSTDEIPKYAWNDTVDLSVTSVAALKTLDANHFLTAKS